MARDVDGSEVLVADVGREGLARRAVEHDHAHHPADAGEQVALPALVVVEAADHALAREGEVRLLHGTRQLRAAHQLHEPAPLVLEAPERDHLDALDHLFTPVSSISRPTSAKSCQCLPPSCHQPSTRCTCSSPRRAEPRVTVARSTCSARRRANSRLTSVISSSPRLEGSSESTISKTSGG